jgi:galactokinase
MSYRSPPDIQVMVHGTIPQGAGLSSSSAFVVASTIALLHAFGDIRMDRKVIIIIHQLSHFLYCFIHCI